AGTGKGFFEGEKDTRAAEVSVLLENFGAPVELFSRDADAGLQREQDIAAAGMQDPFGNGCGAQTVENLAEMIDDQDRNAFVEHVSEDAIAGFEPQQVAVFGVENGSKGMEPGRPAVPRRFVAEDSGGGAVAEKTRADEDAGIV